MHTVINVNGVDYHYGQVSGEEQLNLYQEIGARLLANCVSALKNEIDINILKGLLLGSPNGTIKYIADIVTPKCYKQGEKQPVTIDDFQGDIDNYVLLVCHGLMVNLSDFFISIETQVTELIKELKAREAESSLL